MLARMLREDGFDVEVAFDGASAIARLARSPLPNALLTVFRMAPVDGITVAKYARSLDAHMPIIFITGYPQLVGPKVHAIGAWIHPKPVDYSVLAAEVRRQLDECVGIPLTPVMQPGGGRDQQD